MTVEQFAQMVSSDTEDYELVEGEVIPLPSMTPMHSRVRSQAADAFRSYLRRSPIGEVFAGIDCRVSARTVRPPDLSIFLAERAKLDLDQTPS